MDINEQKMEFISETIDATPIRWDHAFTVLPTGAHKVGMSVGDTANDVPVNIERGLDKVKVKYTHDNHEYTSVIHPDGRSYTHIKFLGNEFESQREWEEKGMWRFY